MKTKALCLLACLCAQIPAGAQPIRLDGPINRQTIIYEMPPGYSAIANPFYHRRGTRVRDSQLDNSVAALFSSVPNGTVLYKFDPQSRTFAVNRFGPRGWKRPAETLNPGEGALFFNPTRRLLRIAVSGDYGN